MKPDLPIRRLPMNWLWLCGALVLLGFGGLTLHRWWPAAQSWVRDTIAARKTLHDSDHDQQTASDSGKSHDHAEHAHAHDDANSLELSPQARGSLGLTADYLKPVQLETFYRSVSIPAMVVERPGRTRIIVSTPMAGVITHVHAVRGEAITPGNLLFEIRITADELVAAQTALLTTIGEIDIERREIARLEEVTRSGAVPQRTLLERQYAKEKLEVILAAQKAALRLQGLSELQVQEIIDHRELLHDLQIRVPTPDDHDDDEIEQIDTVEPQNVDAPTPTPSSSLVDGDTPLAEELHPASLILQEVLVSKGKRVQAGTTLAVLTDLSELYLEGRAFEQDARLLDAAATNNWTMTAVFDHAGQEFDQVPGLELLYAASDVNPESRTLAFYARLPNEITRDVPSPNGLRFIEWKYRLGQRLQLRVPVEEWTSQIVLPVDAIAQDGAEAFVFQQNGNHFDRVPVQIVYRDQQHAVVKNDGSIFPGDLIALRGAHQLQMALKNKSGGGADPHAGHNH